jgi:arylamine N-acetyltransferase
MEASWYRRYLQMLGLEDLEGIPPRLENLNRIVHSHRHMPFESISSLQRRYLAGLVGPVASLNLDEQLDTWERRAGGGVCYEFGAMLGALLDHLGYQPVPNLARISFPGSHSALIVQLPEGRYIADVGNGQPIYEAIPIDTPFEFTRGGLGYRFWLDHELGKLVQDRRERGDWKSYVWYDLEGASDEEMDASMQRHHALPPMTFVMQNFRVVVCRPDEDLVIQLRDHDLIHYRASGKTTQEVYGLARYREVVVDELGMPGLDVEYALNAWAAITGAKI